MLIFAAAGMSYVCKSSANKTADGQAGRRLLNKPRFLTAPVRERGGCSLAGVAYWSATDVSKTMAGNYILHITRGGSVLWHTLEESIASNLLT